jgi:hypothetical protein
MSDADPTDALDKGSDAELFDAAEMSEASRGGTLKRTSLARLRARSLSRISAHGGGGEGGATTTSRRSSLLAPTPTPRAVLNKSPAPGQRKRGSSLLRIARRNSSINEGAGGSLLNGGGGAQQGKGNSALSVTSMHAAWAERSGGYNSARDSVSSVTSSMSLQEASNASLSLAGGRGASPGAVPQRKRSSVGPGSPGAPQQRKRSSVGPASFSRAMSSPLETIYSRPPSNAEESVEVAMLIRKRFAHYNLDDDDDDDGGGGGGGGDNGGGFLAPLAEADIIGSATDDNDDNDDDSHVGVGVGVGGEMQEVKEVQWANGRDARGLLDVGVDGDASTRLTVDADAVSAGGMSSATSNDGSVDGSVGGAPDAPRPWARAVPTSSDLRMLVMAQDVIVFGRNSDCDVIYDSRMVSAVHCKIWRVEDQVGTISITFVNHYLPCLAFATKHSPFALPAFLPSLLFLPGVPRRLFVERHVPR